MNAAWRRSKPAYLCECCTLLMTLVRYSASPLLPTEASCSTRSRHRTLPDQTHQSQSVQDKPVPSSSMIDARNNAVSPVPEPLALCLSLLPPLLQRGALPFARLRVEELIRHRRREAWFARHTFCTTRFNIPTGFHLSTFGLPSPPRPESVSGLTCPCSYCCNERLSPAIQPVGRGTQAIG